MYAADGRTPIAGASVYVYQTDARGYYRPDDAMGNRDPRLRALLRSDARGRYSYRTIRPGSYPGTRVPKHIHYEVTAAGHGTRIFEIVFEDDPFVGAEVRASAARPRLVPFPPRGEAGRRTASGGSCRTSSCPPRLLEALQRLEGPRETLAWLRFARVSVGLAPGQEPRAQRLCSSPVLGPDRVGATRGS